MEKILKIHKSYGLKSVSRNCPMTYVCGKTGEIISRKETTAEHVYSTLKLADFILSEYEEFRDLNKQRVFEILMYHDDCEIETEDICISDEKGRNGKEIREGNGVIALADKYPEKIGERLLSVYAEYTEQITPESKFCKAIDKLDPIIHCILMPETYGETTGFTEENMRRWHGRAFEYSPTFLQIFENFIAWAKAKNYF